MPSLDLSPPCPSVASCHVSVYTSISVPRLWEACSICLSQVCFILLTKFESSGWELQVDPWQIIIKKQPFTYSSSEEPVNCLGIWAILLSTRISGESLTLPIQAVPDPTLMEHTEDLNPNSFFFTPYPDT